MSSLRIGLLFNLKKNAPHLPDAPQDIWGDLDSPTTVEAIAQALASEGHPVMPLEGDRELPQKLASHRIQFAFNICEGHFGESRESQVPALLEMLRIPYTGSGVLTLALTLDKAMCKRVLLAEGLPTPAFQVFHAAEEPVDPRLRYPLFVKPSREGSGMGISAASIARNQTALRQRLRYILERYQEPALAEEFIEGREVTLGMIGNGRPHVFPVLEIDLSPCPPEEAGIYTHRIKAELPSVPRYLCPAPLPASTTQELVHLAEVAYRATGCRDMARIDFRLDAQLRPFILEVNPLPGLSPGISDLVIMAEADGLPYNDLVNSILHHARRRYGM